jgi:hypothetical protein
MSFNKELYSVETIEGKLALRVLFKGETIGSFFHREAYDIIEEHANSPFVSTEVSVDMADMEQQIIDLEQKVEFVESERNYWKRSHEHMHDERDYWKRSHAELGDADSLVQQTIELGEQIDSLEEKVEYWKELALSRDGQPLFTQEDVDNARNFENHVGTDYKLIVDKVNILWEDHERNLNEDGGFTSGG